MVLFESVNIEVTSGHQYLWPFHWFTVYPLSLQILQIGTCTLFKGFWKPIDTETSNSQYIPAIRIVQYWTIVGAML